MSDFFERIQKLSPQRLALLAIELNSRLESIEENRKDAVAVIGIGCRFPGGITDAESYWQLLQNGVDAIQEIPASRWDVDAYYDPDEDKPGKIATRWGGFVENIDAFDAQFFGITPREALTMDPQQRLVLEVAWEALENAGYAPDKLTGTKTGVFLGACNGDYYHMLLDAGTQFSDMYMSTGNAHSVISGRVSYLLGLQGPSLTVDTACSSSMVATHLAYISLKKGDCRMAIAGGVNAILSPETSVALSRAKMMAKDGRCKAFDASADGFVRSEGCGLVVLKRLSDAVADGDRILAVIRGSAINQDGRSNGLTAPNGPSQVSVVRAALEEAGLTPGDVSYVETHGTGTSLGDPIEIQALGEALGPGHTSEKPLMVGSVKTNLGHLESAAGAAGLIKLILSLQHRWIPPHLHLKKLNPYIAWEQLPVSVPTDGVDWQSANGRWIGGISSFGFSGTNVHMLVERAEEPAMVKNDEERPLHPLALSARGSTALQALAARLTDYLQDNPEVPIESVCYTQNTGRGSFSHRVGLVVSNREDAIRQITETARALETGERKPAQVPNRRPQVVFLFTGSGAQWAGMGYQLYQTQPVFRAALQKCDDLFRPYLPEPLLSVIYPESGATALLERMLYTQAATFAIEIALAELWKSWGVTPDATLGHSLGEYSAAVVTGVISLEDGVKLVAARGRLLDSITEPGAMHAVFATKEEVEEVLAGIPEGIAIAGINGPQNIVISGRVRSVEEAIEKFTSRGVKTRRLAISQAGHSPLIDPILDEFERTAASITYHSPQIDYVSCLFGRQVEGSEIMNAGYWRRHLREPVQFFKGIESLHNNRTIFIEIGPHPVLVSMGQRCFTESSALWVPSLREKKEDWAQILESLCAVWKQGIPVDWQGFDLPYKRQRLALPTYPFQRQRFWATPTGHAGQGAGISLSKDSHPLLQRPVRSPGLADTVYETQLSQEFPPFLQHHRIFGEIILPSPAYIEMALTAAEQVFGPGIHRLENLSVQSALLLPQEGQTTAQFVLKPVQNGRAAFEVFSFADDRNEWVKHASGEIAQQTSNPNPSSGHGFRPDEVRARCVEEIRGSDYYPRLAELGLEFGPNFQGIEHIWRRDGEALGKITLPDDLVSDSSHYHIHPAFLDACFHLLGAPLPQTDLDQAYLLIGMARFQLFQKPGGILWNHTVLEPQKNSQEIFTATCRLYNSDGHLVGEASGLTLKRAGREALLRSINKHSDPASANWIYKVAWQPLPLTSIPHNLPAPKQVAARLAESVACYEAEPDYAGYARLSPIFDAYCAAAISSAFERMDFPLVEGQSFTLDVFIQKGQVLPRYTRLSRRLMEILSDQGVLAAEGDGWHVIGHAPATSSIEEIIVEFPAYRAEATLLARCASALAQVLTGEQDALALLFPGGSLEATEALYSQSPYARAFNHLIAEAVAQRIPDEGRLRILEIGAGSGATTRQVLPLLPAGRCDYVFSDLSPVFLDKAQKAFTEYPFIQYQILDIEKDPQKQGLAGQSFDIILAANVLHATADLQQSLAHIQKMLVPGGQLLLLENARKASWVDLTFGLTDGWWRFQDTQLRPEHPVLSQSGWLNLFKACGFQESAALPASVPGSESGSLSGQVLLIAQAHEKVSQTAQETAGSWLVFHNATSSDAAELAQSLRHKGQRCILIGQSQSNDEQVVNITKDQWEVAPGSTAAVADVLMRAAEGGPPITTVIGLFSPTENVSPARQVETDCDRLLHITQAVLAMPQGNRPALWLATYDAQAVGGPPTLEGLPASALWGLGRTLALEHPEIWGGMIDLDPNSSNKKNMAHLVNEIRFADGEDQVAYRKGERFVARLVRGQAPVSAELMLKEDRVYLITGGLGGLGVKIAQWMVQRGARHLVLTGRRGLPPREAWSQFQPDSDLARRAAAVQDLEKAGAQVILYAADTADENAMGKLFQSFGASLPKLGGIVHAAADLSSSTIEEMGVEMLYNMLRPKASGTWLLHKLSQGLDIDFFVLFSSTTALLGSQQLGHYAAANSFLDSFASYRKSTGLPILSINWGTWDTMRIASQAEQQRVAQFGLEQMQADQALHLLGNYLAAQGEAQVVIAAVDWDTLRPAYEARRRRPLMEGLTSRTHGKPAQQITTKPADADLVMLLKEIPPEKQYNMIVRHVREHVAAVIGSTRPETIDEQQGLFEMGLDSLMSVDLKGRLEKSLGQSLPSTLTFNYPTVAELAGYLLERIRPAETPTAETSAPEPEPSAAEKTQADDFDDLSEDELANLLQKKLKGGA